MFRYLFLQEMLFGSVLCVISTFAAISLNEWFDAARDGTSLSTWRDGITLIHDDNGRIINHY